MCKTDCCWLWFGSSHSSGYGKLMVSKRYRLAHQVAYEVAVGPIPDGKIITHDCDVKLCVRPDHLRVGTKTSNLLERYARRGETACCDTTITWI